MHFLRFFAAIFLATTAAVASTPADIYPSWCWSRFGAAEGLPSGVAHVRESADGTIWAGTRDGALWFDGYRFVRPPGPRYTVKKLLALANGHVAFTVDGVLHIGGRDGFAVVPLPFYVFNVVTDESGEIILLSRTSDLFTLQDGDPQLLALPTGVQREDVLNMQSDGEAVWLRIVDGDFRLQGSHWIVNSRAASYAI